MGHRALVAVERRPGTFDCLRWQWGGDPHAGGSPDATVDAAVASGQRLSRSASVSHVIGLLDPLGDDAFVVRSGDRTRRYLVRWLGLPTADGDVEGPTVLVPVGTGGDCGSTDCAESVERLDCALRTAKGVLGDAVDAGLVPAWLAVGYLTVLVERHADVPPGRLWLAPGEGETTPRQDGNAGRPEGED